MPKFTDLISNSALAGAMFATRYAQTRHFQLATRRPMVHQLRLLRRILADNTQTEFGRQHDFDTIADIAAYRSCVPVTSYSDLKPYIDRQCRTREPSLTREPPVMYNRTSGTTGEPKFLPVTRRGLIGLRRAQRLFAQAQFAGSSLYRGRILAVASPAVEGRMENGIPYGSATGLIYATMPKFVQSKYVIPPEVFAVSDYEAKYYAIAALGLRDRKITGLATANPSTFHKIIDVIRSRWDSLLYDIKTGQCAVEDRLSPIQRDAFLNRFHAAPERARELAALGKQAHEIVFADIWPRLGGIVTWTGGSCGFALASLADQWPKASRIMEAGYVSSEVWGSINLDVERSACVPTITDAFFEFVERNDWEDGRHAFRTLDEIEEGQQYYVFVTTANGLYRYDMNDIIAVTGRFNATPTIAFVQKGRGVTSITGEKLYENQVTQAVTLIQWDHHLSIPFFVALADEQTNRYQIYLEIPDTGGNPMETIGRHLDRRLGELNIEYREKRASGRLMPLRAIPVKSGTGDLYRKHCVAHGQRDAQFKVLQLQYKRDCQFDFAGQHLSAA